MVTDREQYEFIAASIAGIEAVCFLLMPAIAPNGILTGQKRGPLRADRTGVFFRKKLLLPRERIECVWVEELAEGPCYVHLSGARTADDLSVHVEDSARARALLEALELRHDRHAASFVVESAPLRTRFMQGLARALIYSIGAALVGYVLYRTDDNALIGFLLVPVLIVYSIIVRRARLTSRLVVGADGLVVRAGGKLRQIPLASIRKVSSGGKVESVVELSSTPPATSQREPEGEKLRFRFAGDGAAEKSAAFTTRLHESLVQQKEDREPPRIAGLLARAGRSTRDWLGELRRLGSGQEGYRAGAVPDEELWRVIEHVGADSAARVGAVIALRARLDEIGRTRIGEIAGGTAHRDLRAALEAAAAGESEERIASAFEAKQGSANE